MSDSKETLFDRIGGEEGVAKLVDAFYERIFDDPELAPFFEHTPKDRLNRMQREFFAAALDGPIKYNGRPLNEAHYGRGITTRHVGLFVQHLMETLEGQGLDEKDNYDIISRINTYVDEITGDAGVDG